jgi:MFS family permease
LLTDITPPPVRGGVVGLYRTFQDIGGFSGPILFMIFYSTLGPVYAFYIAIAANVANIALLMMFKVPAKN